MSDTRKPDINLWEVLYRKRLGLGPFYVGAFAAALAGLSALLTEWQVLIGLLATATALCVWVITRVNDRVRRAYALSVVLITCAWIFAARTYVPEATGWIVLANLVGCLLLGIGWWTSHRKRSQVKMEDTLRDWPVVAKRIGLEHIPPPNIIMTPTGYKGRFTWPKGTYDVDEVRSRQKKIEGALGAEAGTLQLPFDGKSTNSINFVVTQRDPHAAPQAWQPPTHLRRATDPIRIGPQTDGNVLELRRFEPGRGSRHMLVSGATDSGKSSVVNLCVAEDVCSDQVFPIGFDFKQVELTPWREAMGAVITQREVAAALVRAFAAPGGLLETRGEKLARRGARVWNPDIDGPIISLTVDEAKTLLGATDTKTIDAFAEFANRGRALGCGFLLATQYPTLEAIGSSQIREQCRHRLCFRMESEKGETFVIQSRRVYAERIDAERPGTAYVRDAAHVYELPVRVYWLDDDMISTIVVSRAGQTPELDEESLAAIELHFPEFRDYMYGTGGTSAGTEEEAAGTEDDETGTEEDEVPEWLDLRSGPQVNPEQVIAAQRSRLSEDARDKLDRDRAAALAEGESRKKLSEQEAKQAVLATLAEAWPEPVRAKELYTAATRSSSWFYPVANAMAEKGIVRRSQETGGWQLVSAPPQLVAAE